MKTLFIDTSTAFLVVAIIEDQHPCFFVKKEGKNNHSDHLLNQIQEGLNQTKIDFKDFDRVVVAIGPGAYTGLRISLTVAKMLCWTLSIPLYTISSLDSLASGWLNQDKEYVLFMHAKKDYVFASIIKMQNGLKQVLQEETYLSMQEFNEKCALYPEAILINEQNAKWDITKLDASFFLIHEEVHLLEPNYLRGEL